MLLGILLAILIVVCIALCGVILLQQSEGGALGMGGGPSGFMTARGAGDLLTRTTWILGSIFFALCLALTFFSGHMKSGGSVVDRLKVDALNPDALSTKKPAAPAPAQGKPAAPANGGFEAPKPEVHNTVSNTADPFGNLGAQPAPPAKH
jgi:preprotein translocase subunit SecG